MRILFINPNSTESMTCKVLTSARQFAPAGVEILARTNRDGPAAIQGADDGDSAVPGLMHVIESASEESIDAFVIACFDDTGIEQARRRTNTPVLGIGQAAFHASMLMGKPFSVVTTLSVSIPVIEQNIAYCGVGSFCRKVRASEVPVLDLEKPGSDAEQRVSQEIAEAVTYDNCEAIVLGCAGMTDLAGRLEQTHQIPVIDGVSAATGLAYAVAALRSE